MIWAQMWVDVGAKRMAGHAEDHDWPRGDFVLAIGGISPGHTGSRVAVGGRNDLPPMRNIFPQ